MEEAKKSQNLRFLRKSKFDFQGFPKSALAGTFRKFEDVVSKILDFRPEKCPTRALFGKHLKFDDADLKIALRAIFGAEKCPTRALFGNLRNRA